MKTTQEKIVVMQGDVDEKTIVVTVRGKNNWFIVAKPIAWNWVLYDYEIQSEPQEFWVNVYRDTDEYTIHASVRGAIKSSVAGDVVPDRIAVHMREVTGEDDG